MKLDKIKFAMLVALMADKGAAFSMEELADIDALIDIETPPAPAMNATDLHVLMALMQAGTNKIDAIKQHRQMTGYGLKDSKDIVEKYWPNTKQKLLDLLDKRDNLAGEYMIIQKFLHELT